MLCGGGMGREWWCFVLELKYNAAWCCTKTSEKEEGGF